jgi:cysteine synthase A
MIMTKIAKQLTDLIGNTPMMELNKYSLNEGIKKPLMVKVEYFNPGGSVKDRIALAMIEDAEQKGILKPEPQSLNQQAATRASVWRLFQPLKVIN